MQQVMWQVLPSSQVEADSAFVWLLFVSVNSYEYQTAALV